MNLTMDCWTALTHLQRNLKKEFLLVEKQQQEKIKLKRQIEDLVRSYHQHSIEIHSPTAQLLKEEGFDNCYNFIKDVVITISTNYQLGKLILYLSHYQTSLPSLVIHGLYDNIQTSDPFSKEITRLMHSLTVDLQDSQVPASHKEKTIEAWKLYMKKVEREVYFQQIAEPTLKKLIRQEQVIDSTIKDKEVSQTEKMAYRVPLEIVDKEQLIADYLEKIASEAQLCLPSIKIALRALADKQTSNNKQSLGKVWALISHFYLSPFLKVAGNNELPSETKEKILQFVDDLVSKWGFTGELTFRSLEQKDSPRNESGMLNVELVCSRLVEVNEQRLNRFLVGNLPNNLEIQIKIFGACLSLVQLYELLVLIQGNRQAFSKLSERVVSRTLKISQISPNLQVLHRERPGMLFVSLFELRYEQSICSDYYKNYTVVYRGETLKQMLKQVLVQIENLSDLRAEHKNTLNLIFQSLVHQQSSYRNGVTISAQLQMKIKYLIYLLAKEQPQQEALLMNEMQVELKDRDSISIKLYQETKFSLLKVYCNLRNLKNQLKYQRESERKLTSRIGLIRKLQDLKLDICLTSKASRNQTEGEQHLDKYRYRLSTADDILIQLTSDCIHRENTFTGRLNHPNSISKFLQTFASLDQVRHYLRHPSFIASEYSPNLYLYCNQTKIGQALYCFIKIVGEKLKLTQDEKQVLESVIFRSLNGLLLGSKDCPLGSSIDRSLLEATNEFSLYDVNDCQSPRRRISEGRKRKGSYQLSESEITPTLQQLEIVYKEQLHEMGRRYLSSLSDASTPIEKIRKLRDIIDIYKIALGKQEAKGEPKVSEAIQQLLIKTIMAAKCPNLVSQLAFLEMFLPQVKLMSGDGKVLKQFQKGVERFFKERGCRDMSPRKRGRDIVIQLKKV